MAGADRNNETPPELPPEILLFHILPKLPAKSILRFKCVCKQWRSFLLTSEFAKIQLHHVTTVDRYCHEKVLFLLTSPSRKFQTIDCEDGLLSTPRCYPFGGCSSIISSSVNGLACVGIRENPIEYTDIILWNPLTGEYKKLSRPNDTKCYHWMVITFELFYTCSDDDYKILRITSDGNAYIYSLKSDSWRKLELRLDYLERIPYVDNHNLLDDKLHFLMRSWTSRYVIIRLDLKTEKFTKIEIPFVNGDGCFSLMVGRGCIELTIWKLEPRQYTIEVLKMDGDGNWTKVVTSSYCSDLPINRSSLLKPLHLMRNGNWLGYTINGIYKIDPEKNIKEELSSISNMIINPRGKYIETFVSPNQYIN